jgi:hypothetical protein
MYDIHHNDEILQSPYNQMGKSTYSMRHLLSLMTRVLNPDVAATFSTSHLCPMMPNSLPSAIRDIYEQGYSMLWFKERCDGSVGVRCSVQQRLSLV